MIPAAGDARQQHQAQRQARRPGRLVSSPGARTNCPQPAPPASRKGSIASGPATTRLPGSAPGGEQVCSSYSAGKHNGLYSLERAETGWARGLVQYSHARWEEALRDVLTCAAPRVRIAPR